MRYQREAGKKPTGIVIVLFNTHELFGQQKVAGYTIPDPTQAVKGEATRNACLGWEPQ
jgi:hypothetical protein